MRRVLKGMAVAGLLFACVVLLYGLRVARGPSYRTGELVIAGISMPVEVFRDSLGVPQIYAATLEDALFAQGFLHASDRLWQIEMFRRVAQGRLSEIYGERTLATDRFLRTLGMRRAGDATRAGLDEETLRHIRSYVNGLNAAIEEWRGPRPPEFVLLGLEPEPFTVEDVLAIEKVMAWDLADYGGSLALAGARAALSDEDFALVRPGSAPWGATILKDGEDQVEPRTQVGSTSPNPRIMVDARLLSLADIPEEALPFLEATNAVRASNSWVVGPDRSASGLPLLANDMHLGLSAPPIWYLAGIHAPGFDVVGMSLPGTPGVVAGHSAAVAWGFTNASLDDSDFFIERLDPEDDTRYLTPEGSEQFQTRVEEIFVKGRDEPDRFEVRETRHGPIVTPVEGRFGTDLIAFQWIAHRPSHSARAFTNMARAQSVPEFIEALRDFDNPHQNIVFADTAGSFGYWMAGTIPVRANGKPNILPMPGWTGDFDWVGIVPFEDHPHVVNPARGFVATANNRQGWSAAAELVSDGSWAPPYRAQRIEELILATPMHDAASLAAIQMDVKDAFATRYRMAAVDAFRSAGLGTHADSLEAWDGESVRESRAATLFYTWRARLRLGIGERLYGAGGGYTPTRALERVLDAEDGRLAEWRAEVVVQAALATSEVAGDSPWGDVHRMRLDHPLSTVPVIGRLLGFGRSGISIPGGTHSVSVAAFGGSTPPYTVTHGASQRHVVDLADLDGVGGFILPGGQSGFPRHPNAFDQLPRFLAGELIPIPLHRASAEARSVHRLRLIPG